MNNLMRSLFTSQKTSKQYNHIFLDLETLGTKHDAPILVIAAYAVDHFGNYLARAQWRIDIEDAKNHGQACPDTVEWWSKQDFVAKYAAFEQGPRISLAHALVDLEGLITGQIGFDNDGNPPFIWGNAPTFDCAILRHAYEQVGQEVPWEYWQERDVRTMAWVGKQMGYDAKKNLQFDGTPHDALDDARHQARYTISILNKI